MIHENAKTTFTFTGDQYEKIVSLATKDFNRWEQQALRGGKQCKNTLRGCIVGSAAEFASGHYLNYILLQQLNTDYKIKMWGCMERRDSKSYNKPDIQLCAQGKELGIEVKGVTKGYPRGQITVYHGNKYNREADIHRVMFVEVFHDEDKKELVCEVYEYAKTSDIVKWKLKNNLIGNKCYTHSDYI